ncbi:MAG: isoprenyl transferase [Rikenellaceae bacterium]
MNDKSIVPNHIAIIMDGNGRWASQRGEERLKGHLMGVNSVKGAVEGCVKHGVRYLSLYAFSTENWGRPQEEVEGLMELFCSTIAKELSSLIREGVRLRFMGRIEELNESVKENIRIAEELTKENDTLTVIIALNYGSQIEIADAVREIASEVKNGALCVEKIDCELISSKLYINDVPNPDLLIRTSGEQRVSNFMLWQLAYSEFYFTPVLWPDFSEKELVEAIEEYGNRERRYGKI